MNRRKLHIFYILRSIGIRAKKEFKPKRGGNNNGSKDREPFKREEGFIKLNHFYFPLFIVKPSVGQKFKMGPA